MLSQVCAKLYEPALLQTGMLSVTGVYMPTLLVLSLGYNLLYIRYMVGQACRATAGYHTDQVIGALVLLAPDDKASLRTHQHELRQQQQQDYT